MRKLQRQILMPHEILLKSGHRVVCFLCADCGLYLTETGQVKPLSSPPLSPGHPVVCDAWPCNGRPTHLRPWYIVLEKEARYE